MCPGLRTLAGAGLAALAGCATPSAVEMTPPVNPSPAVVGAVAFAAQGSGTTVGYGTWGVSGPGVELGYAGHGQWAGRIDGTDVRISTSWGRIQGPGIDLAVYRSGKELLVRGDWGGRNVDITVGRDRLTGSPDGGSCSFHFAATVPGELAGELGCLAAPGGHPSASTGTLKLQGEAILVPDVLMPQFVLALLTALPH